MTEEKKPQAIHALDEFPDGGRATLVRRYSPVLTKRELGILRACPYESPGHVAGKDKTTLRLARVLKRAGLLEEDPQTPYHFRVTDAGAQVVHLWKSAGWLA